VTSEVTSDAHPPTSSGQPAEIKLNPTGTQRIAGFAFSALALVATLALGQFFSPKADKTPADPIWNVLPTPLVMQGGDPYIRALMRTISAAESNSTRPYSLLYGGDHIDDLSRHPDACVPIVAGPNLGNCTTAAGRYQFITTTWLEQAAQYHPQPSGFWFMQEYSFAPEFQDQVVYHWLSNPEAWGIDLAALLRQERLEEVLEILSPTWTSLGYGIEPNSMTDLLPQIYQQMLAEELQLGSSF
jgi:muramidase (phage lysozyme)